LFFQVLYFSGLQFLVSWSDMDQNYRLIETTPDFLRLRFHSLNSYPFLNDQWSLSTTWVIDFLYDTISPPLRPSWLKVVGNFRAGCAFHILLVKPERGCNPRKHFIEFALLVWGNQCPLTPQCIEAGLENQDIRDVSCGWGGLEDLFDEESHCILYTTLIKTHLIYVTANQSQFNAKRCCWKPKFLLWKLTTSHYYLPSLMLCHVLCMKSDSFTIYFSMPI